MKWTVQGFLCTCVVLAANGSTCFAIALHLRYTCVALAAKGSTCFALALHLRCTCSQRQHLLCTCSALVAFTRPAPGPQLCT